MKKEINHRKLTQYLKEHNMEKLFLNEEKRKVFVCLHFAHIICRNHVQCTPHKKTNRESTSNEQFSSHLFWVGDSNEMYCLVSS